jgi:transcriptional regulator with XRE-family HTH domain
MGAITREERRAVGHRIRTLREAQGWPREELARRLGVHRGSIARWETGGSVPHAHTVRRIARMAGTTAEWVRTGTLGGPAPAAGHVDTDDADPFTTHLTVVRFLAGIAPAGREPLRKLDALDGLRRMLTARGELPGWWYGLRARVEAGTL